VLRFRCGFWFNLDYRGNRTPFKEKCVRRATSNPLHVGAPMPGLVVRELVAPEDHVAAGQKLCMPEAMKMEMTLQADRAGQVAEVLVRARTQVESGDLLIRYQG
jgi:pyruvate carboxylase